jgi:hypothetical protein
MELEGIVPILLTPFDDAEAVDHAALGREIDFVAPAAAMRRARRAPAARARGGDSSVNTGSHVPANA